MAKKEYAPKAQEPSTEGALYVPSKDESACAPAGIRSPKHGPEACCLVSRNDHSTHVQYDGKTMVLSPRQGAKHPCVVADSSLLSMPLPKGVFKIPLPAHLRA